VQETLKTKILTFDSVHHALRAEKILREKGIPISVINTPRHISSDCGISLRFEDKLEQRIVKVLKDESAQYKNIYVL
jgi:hypothetical protein